jgi:hypothetical protein
MHSSSLWRCYCTVSASCIVFYEGKSGNQKSGKIEIWNRNLGTPYRFRRDGAVTKSTQNHTTGNLGTPYGKIGTLTIFDRDANSDDLIDDPGAPGVATYSYDPASPQGLRRAGPGNLGTP